MVADYEKYNSAISNLSSLSIWISSPRRYLPLKWLLLYRANREKLVINAGENDEPKPGRWYHAGIDKTCSMLEKVGYQVLNPDVGTNLRDPIIHFIKAYQPHPADLLRCGSQTADTDR